MSGISVEIQVSTEEVSARLKRMVEQMDRPIGFYRQVGEHMLNSTRDNFSAESSPQDVPWAQLKPSTIRAREKKRQTPIRKLQVTKNTGLMASINVRPTDTEVRIGSPKEYAAIHQLGGTIQKAARKHSWIKGGEKNVSIPAHQITIPARPYLGVSEEDERIIIEIADEWLNEE
ncbi:phage virion morphogenesis protein [Oceaniglobus trochenteri]|uniref:phage virion morphogenesis protein n=1 Tax=Oceaniglobus trochenteri TaxID=2763260 RepID=UPI001CFFDD9E|nr:phage virion morphogenesis protein [Oceaniglobus trochenteri]